MSENLKKFITLSPFVVFLLWVALHQPMGCYDGPGSWRGGRCAMGRKYLGKVINRYNFCHPVPIVTIDEPLIQKLIDEGYFRDETFCPDDAYLVLCSGGYLPDPPTKWQIFLDDIQFRLRENVFLPLPLLSTIGGASWHDPGTFMLATSPFGLKINCSVHGEGTSIPPVPLPSLPTSQSDLLLAICQGKASDVFRLLEQGVPIPETTVEGRDPLAIAAHYGHFDVVRRFLDDLPPESRKEAANRLLPETLEFEWTDVASHLVDLGAEVDQRKSGGQETLLFVAIQEQRPEFVRFLVSAGADLTASVNGMTPLGRARAQAGVMNPVRNAIIGIIERAGGK